MRTRLLLALSVLVLWPLYQAAAQGAPSPQAPVRTFTVWLGHDPFVHAAVTFDGPVHRTAVTDNRGSVRLPLPDGDYTITVEGFAGPRVVFTARFDATHSAITIYQSDWPPPTEIPTAQPEVPTSESQAAPLRQAPGIVFDRVDIGGSEAQQQPAVFANGAISRDTTWLLDRSIPVTSVNTMGRSAVNASTHLFESLWLVNPDFNMDTPGAAGAFELPSGTGQLRATAYGIVGSSAFTGNNVDATTSGVSSYRRIARDIDGGFQIGGPIRVDANGQPTLQGWAGYDVSTPRLSVRDRVGQAFTNSATDSTVLHDGAARLFWNPWWGRLEFTYVGDHKARDGIDAGSTRPIDSALSERQTTNLGAVQLTRNVGRFILDSQYSLMSERSDLQPSSGRDTPGYLDAAGVWHNGYQFVDGRALQHDAAVYLVGPSLKWYGGFLVGVDLRRASIDRLSGWSGGQFAEDEGSPVLLAHAVQDRRELGHALYLKTFVEYVKHWQRLSFNADLVWHRQATSADSTTIAASPLAPAALPALSIPAQSNVVVWSLFSPRADLAYELGHSRLYASYARFSTPMDAALGADLAGAPMSATALITVIDKNGDHVLSPGDVSTIAATTITTTRVGATSTPRTDRVSGGWSIYGRQVGVSAGVTFQQTTDMNWLHLDGITGAGFTSTSTVSGSVPPIQTFAVPLSRVNGALLPSSFLQTYEARPGYSQQYWGFGAEVRSTNPRHPWTLGVKSGQSQEHFASIAARYDPTPMPPGLDVFSLDSPNVDRGDLGFASVDTNGQTVFVTTPRYQLFAAASIDLPWKLRATPAYFVREGFALPYFSAVPGSADASSPDGKDVLLTGAIAAFRLPAVHEVDLRISRPLTLFGRASTVDVDVFNLLNRATPLARDLNVRSVTFNQITEVMSPLTVRIGVRVPIR